MSLEDQFHVAMLDVYRRALAECNYPANYFLRMVNEQGGLQAAKTLINADKLSDGFTALYLRDRLDLTVEAVVMNPMWHPLFTPDELARAKRRLTDLHYPVV